MSLGLVRLVAGNKAALSIAKPRQNVWSGVQIKLGSPLHAGHSRLLKGVIPLLHCGEPRDLQERQMVYFLQEACLICYTGRYGWGQILGADGICARILIVNRVARLSLLSKRRET